MPLKPSKVRTLLSKFYESSRIYTGVVDEEEGK